MASNNYMMPLEWNFSRRVAWVHELDLDSYTALAAQVSTIQQQLDAALKVNAIKSPTSVCEIRDCQRGSPFAQPEHFNYVNNFQRRQGNPYSNNYTPAW